MSMYSCLPSGEEVGGFRLEEGADRLERKGGIDGEFHVFPGVFLQVERACEPALGALLVF